MNNKKQNSIEWLVQELNRNIDFIPNVHHWDKIRHIIQQAKAMHKDEIENAVNFGTTQWGGWEALSGEDYYNKTFNTKEK